MTSQICSITRESARKSTDLSICAPNSAVSDKKILALPARDSTNPSTIKRLDFSSVFVTLQQVRKGIKVPNLSPDSMKLSHTIVIFLAAWLVSCASPEQTALIRQATTCEVHGYKMEHVVLTKDEYAGRYMTDEFYAARGGIFPHSGTAFPVCTFYPNRDMTWRCPECASAGAIWCKEHLQERPFL
jgi:hypothetical protein